MSATWCEGHDEKMHTSWDACGYHVQGIQIPWLNDGSCQRNFNIVEHLSGDGICVRGEGCIQHTDGVFSYPISCAWV